MNIRKIRKWIAYLLFAYSLLLAIPSGIDDILNFNLASLLVAKLGIAQIDALIATYTIIPILLIIFAVILYPAQNGYVISKFKAKFMAKSKFLRSKFKKNPFISSAIAIIFFIIIYNLFKIYYNWISKFIK